MTVRRRRHVQASKPIVLPEPPDMRKAKRLPMFGPGIVIRIPLIHWPAYKDMYHLEPTGYRESSGVLLVKRVPPETDKEQE
jgi:hypothetical protein